MDRTSAAYDEDFYAWTQTQAQEFRRAGAERDNAPIDWENVAEEIESMGRGQRSDVRNRLCVLLTHLLKWQHCPELRERCANGWRRTVREQWKQVACEFDDSPSLRRQLGDLFVIAYADAREYAADEADVAIAHFPSDPTFTLDDALDPAFPPDLFPPELRG
ncbi:DUF29 domain-containing protein [Azospirillum sp. RWY-5-1]|uniref:DUF29 domain-containing protein n=1 Tax=Azospirillum oleiclasticum TaxID=2735135 RepID=A0ABX2T4Q4_9PROT|nr:DUF29 domain-containing protein [Azospirillum oleiclasticum]NYZ12034.1 DUF29 domain-containing protein [Azospirillum oleiclasticum]NYZ19194.1 DUF29 domain-containing protein [Azospirillum oleiclasticum]